MSNFGLAGFGTALGEEHSLEDLTARRPEDLERLRGHGYERLHVAAESTGLVDLAEAAGRAALVDAACDPADVDLVVLGVTDLVEHLYWDAAAVLAARLGTTRAEAVLAPQACTTGVVALDTVAGRLATHPSYEVALVVTANRTVEAYCPRLDSQPLLSSDGAAATLARRDHETLRWLVTETRTDGELGGLFRLEAGGAARPFGAGTAPEDLRVGDAWSVMEHFGYDAERFAAFMETLDVHLVEVLESACRRAGRSTDELSWVLLTHDTAEAYRLAFAALGIDLERGNAELAAAHGHLGAADQLHDLAVLRERGDLAAGDVVALLGRGRGMHWACSLLEV